MNLSNAQYDAMMHEYEQTRKRHQAELDTRRQEIYLALPELKQLEEETANLALESGKKILNGQSYTIQDFRRALSDLMSKKEALLSAHGYRKEDLQLQYTCPDCKDTGLRNHTFCHCFQTKMRKLYYAQSNLEKLMETNNFSHLRTDLFREEEDQRRFYLAYQTCRDFLSDFPQKEGCQNILFYGTVGSGKSFLSIATAKEVLDLGYRVLYFSSGELFDRLADAVFDYKGEGRRLSAFREDLISCDLLVIDDLGAEVTNAFVSARLFDLVNERKLRGTSTIISTNLNLEELRSRYSDRLFSRLIADYTVLELAGGDVRLANKFMRTN